MIRINVTGSSSKQDALDAVDSISCPTVVTLDDGRSKDQNSLLHMWCDEISRYFKSVGKIHLECGAAVSKETIKAKLKGMYLPTIVEPFWDCAEKRVMHRTIPKHTSDLSVKQFFNFMTCIHNFCIDYRIPITIPEDSVYYGMRQEQGMTA
jgi:hypothetical protein